MARSGLFICPREVRAPVTWYATHVRIADLFSVARALFEPQHFCIKPGLSVLYRYLLLFENPLRDFNCNVTLPYWDWSLFSNTPWHRGMDSIWYGGLEGLGGNGVEAAGDWRRCIRDGPFESYRTDEGHCITRRFNGRQIAQLQLKCPVRRQLRSIAKAGASRPNHCFALNPLYFNSDQRQISL